MVHIAPAGLAGSPGKDIDRVALFDGESHPGGGLIGVDRSYGGGVEDWADDYLRMGQELGELVGEDRAPVLDPGHAGGNAEVISGDVDHQGVGGKRVLAQRTPRQHADRGGPPAVEVTTQRGIGGRRKGLGDLGEHVIEQDAVHGVDEAVEAHMPVFDLRYPDLA